MRNASGTFTVIYRPTGRRGDDKYEYGITANNRAELKRKANRARANGYHIQAIIWQSDESLCIWEKRKNQLFDQCWDEERCKLAFGD